MQDEDAALGIGFDELDADREPQDFKRGAGGAPKVRDPEGEGFVTYSRCSSLGDTLDDKTALQSWLVDRAMDGVAAHPELQAEVIAAKERSDYQKCRDRAITLGRGKYKADLGTAVHAMSERFEQEPTWDPGEPYRTALEVYMECLEEAGLTSQLFEVKIVNDEHRSAGTTDRLWQLTKTLVTPDGSRLDPGTLVIGDLKTGSLTYSLPVYTVQAALYAGGVLYDVEADKRLPTPEINQDWAIIAHLDVDEGTCELLWLDLQVGRAGASMANEVREWRRAWRRKDGFKAGVQPVEAAEQSEEPTGDQSWRDKAKANRPGPPTLDEIREFAVARIARLADHGEARQWAVLRWPKGLPSPKKATTQQELLDALAFLDTVEAQFEMQWPEGDVRARFAT